MQFSFSRAVFRGTAARRGLGVVAIAGAMLATPVAADSINALAGLARVSEHVFLDWARSCQRGVRDYQCATRSSSVTTGGAVVPPAGGLAIDFSGLGPNVDLRMVEFRPVARAKVKTCSLNAVGTLAINLGSSSASCVNSLVEGVTVYRAVQKQKSAIKHQTLLTSTHFNTRCAYDNWDGGPNKPYCSDNLKARANIRWNFQRVDAVANGYVLRPATNLRNALDSGNSGGNYFHGTPNPKNPHQVWIFHHLGNGVYEIENQKHHKVLDANGGRGQPYLRARDRRNQNTHWRLIRDGNFLRIYSVLRP